MASKRKSTVPCMIPSKIMRPSEEAAERDSLLLLRQAKISGVERRVRVDPAESSKAEAVDVDGEGAGTYACKPCDFETPDLNLFLDHVYSGHPDFRTDPSFLCLSCGVSAPKFEGLALHNARVHPSTWNTTLQLRRKDKGVVVEQSLLAEADSGKDAEITISKTPIMRMLKGKSEPKRIVVSHPLLCNDSSPDVERKEAAAAVKVTHVPTIVQNGTAKVTLPSAIQIVNGSGALPVLKTPISQVVSVVQNRSPITASSASPSSSENLPKVMIPLSSIPTYSASMDSSSFLKTSFNKFPYPTKAELCYLTVVTRFPEEQIKIWFTAQRLKQGISWSPEEIEEARRKMFNTIIQTAPTTMQSHQSPAQHTITVLPASLGAAGIPHILQGSLVSQGGVIVTQPMMANGIQVNSAPVALAVTPKPQAAARPMMQARPAAALVADKGVGMFVGTVGSSSSGGGGGGSTVISSSSKGGRGGGGALSSIVSGCQASVINLSLGGGGHGRASGVNGKRGVANAECSSNKSKSNASKNGDNIGATTDAKSSTDGKKGSKSSTGAEDVDPAFSDPLSFKMDDVPSPGSKSSSPSPSSHISSAFGSRTPVNAFLDPGFFKSKKSAEQLSTLKDSFLLAQFPDQEEVVRLTTLTGLAVREVRKWFSDRRYHFRNHKGPRASAGAQGARSGAAVGTGSGSSTPGSGAAGGTNLGDLSETSSAGSSNSGAKTPQHSSAAHSPTATQTPTSPTTPSRRHHRPPSPDFTAIRYKERDPRQVKALESSFAQDPDPAEEEVDRLRSETKMTRREIHGWFSERRKRAAAAEKKKEEEEAAAAAAAAAGMEDEEERQREDGSAGLKVNPIKINLKMLKVTEASGKAEADGLDASLSPPATSSPGPASSSNAKPSLSSALTHKPSLSSVAAPKPSSGRGKKSAEQLHMLKQVYARTQWPTAAQYDDLIATSGLSRPEVVRWFGDCRYVQKNGQLKWLEEYQRTALEDELLVDKTQVLQSHLENHGMLDETQLQDLVQQSGLTADLVKHWFTTKATLPQTEPRKSAAIVVVAAAAAECVTEPDPVVPGVAAEPQATGSSPLESQPGGGSEEKMEQSVCGGETAAVAADAEEVTADKTSDPIEGGD